MYRRLPRRSRQRVKRQRRVGLAGRAARPRRSPMSQEHFERIDNRLDRLEGDVIALRVDVAGLKTDVGGLKTDVGSLKTDVAGLTAAVAALDIKQDDHARQMRVLHEDLVDRIKAIPTDGPTRAEMQRGFDTLREAI